MIDSIPPELASLRQWVCFDITDGKKIPYVPGTDNLAASNRPADWRSLRQALKDVEDGKRQRIGFAFASSDPYTFIDLDDLTDPEQAEVLERINSYAQRSVSGNGVHIICEGTFRGAGKHPKKPSAGIFKECRFCLWTADILPGRDKILPVSASTLQSVHSWLGGGRELERTELVEYEADFSDMTVFQLADDAFERFGKLTAGKWAEFDYGSHSDADHALLAMLCDTTDCNEQVRNIFKMSGLWTEERQAAKSAHGPNGYIDRTIVKIRGKQEKLDKAFEQTASLRKTFAAKEAPADIPDIGARNIIDGMPDGLMKDIANYSFNSAYLPLQEASIVVAMTLMAGMCGRGYLTTSKQGLNLWTIIVGKTGCGKDELQQGIKRLLNAIAKKRPHARKLMAGELVSGPSIETAFQTTYRMIAYYKEFGPTFKTLVNPNGQEHTRSLVGGLLNSYNCAGADGSIEIRKKAKNEDAKDSIHRPALTIVGDSTPEGLYGSVTVRELSSGFLQRFMLVDVSPHSYSLRSNPKHGTKPSSALVNKLEELFGKMDAFDATENAIPYTVETSKEAEELLNEHAYQKRKKMMMADVSSVADEVFNRSGMKVYRLSALIAISADFYNPVVSVEHVQWAIDFVEWLDASMLAKFSTGEIGGGQIKQESEVAKALEEISSASASSRQRMGMSKEIAGDVGLCPHSVLKKRVVNLPAFSEDRVGAVSAFEKCLENMIRSGSISRVSKEKALEAYGIAGELFVLLKC